VSRRAIRCGQCGLSVEQLWHPAVTRSFAELEAEVRPGRAGWNSEVHSADLSLPAFDQKSADPQFVLRLRQSISVTNKQGISRTHVASAQYAVASGQTGSPTGCTALSSAMLCVHSAKLSRAARKVVRLAAGRAAYQRGAARTGRSVGEMFLTGPLSISPVHGTRSTLTNQAQVRGIIPQSNFILECSYAEWFGSVFS
jgi:hypothetical protein